MPDIAPKRNRRWRPCFSPHLYRNRNAVERMFGQFKDFRRIATRLTNLWARSAAVRFKILDRVHDIDSTRFQTFRGV